jgi:hypothetical protein
MENCFVHLGLAQNNRPIMATPTGPTPSRMRLHCPAWPPATPAPLPTPIPHRPQSLPRTLLSLLLHASKPAPLLLLHLAAPSGPPPLSPFSSLRKRSRRAPVHHFCPSSPRPPPQSAATMQHTLVMPFCQFRTPATTPLTKFRVARRCSTIAWWAPPSYSPSPKLASLPHPHSLAPCCRSRPDYRQPLEHRRSEWTPPCRLLPATLSMSGLIGEPPLLTPCPVHSPISTRAPPLHLDVWAAGHGRAATRASGVVTRRTGLGRPGHIGYWAMPRHKA